MAWSHVIITTSPNEQLLSNPWPLAKSKVLYRWWIKKCHTPIWSLQNLVKKFSHTAQCTAQWLQPVLSHPWRLVYTQIHHARRQVAPLFRHQKTYTLVERNLDNKLDGNKTLSQLATWEVKQLAPPGFWRLRSHDGPTASPKLRPNLRVIFSTDILSRLDSLVDCLIGWLVGRARLRFGQRCKKDIQKSQGNFEDFNRALSSIEPLRPAQVLFGKTGGVGKPE